MEWLSDPQIWLALLTLTTLEIVLGIDNIIFIAILAGKLPGHLQARGRTIGLLLAMFMRVALLFSITWIMRLTAPLFAVFFDYFLFDHLVTLWSAVGIALIMCGGITITYREGGRRESSQV